jgi:hypothetical protein
MIPPVAAISPAEIRHKRYRTFDHQKRLKSATFWTDTGSCEVSVKRDKSRSETDFGGFGSLSGFGASRKTAQKLGIFSLPQGHLIDSH